MGDRHSGSSWCVPGRLSYLAPSVTDYWPISRILSSDGRYCALFGTVTSRECDAVMVVRASFHVFGWRKRPASPVFTGATVRSKWPFASSVGVDAKFHLGVEEEFSVRSRPTCCCLWGSCLKYVDGGAWVGLSPCPQRGLLLVVLGGDFLS